MKRRPAYLAALALVAACANDPVAARIQQPLAANIIVITGDSQVGTVHQQLPSAIVARVLDDSGKPVKGQPVAWHIVSGGGAVFAGFGLTDGNGEAHELWTLGDTASAQVLEARAVDSTGQPLMFARITAFARPGPVASIGASDTTLFVGQALAIAALLHNPRDAYGNSIDTLPAFVGAPDTLTLHAEAHDTLTIQIGAAVVHPHVTTLRDLRQRTWHFSLACRNDPVAIRGVENPPIGIDSEWVNTTSDSVTYGAGFAPTIWTTGTVTYWWKDGLAVVNGGATIHLDHLTQDVGQVGAYVLAGDSSYIGPNACPNEYQGAPTLPRLVPQ